MTSKTPITSVLLIHLGGTFGMVNHNSYLINKPNVLKSNIQLSARLNHSDNGKNLKYKNGQKEIQYEIYEGEIKDSSDFKPGDWAKIAITLSEFYQSFDAFIIIHGTDTMSYSASAVSFLIENVSKPIIFTGAMVPLGHPDSDAEDNLEGSFKALLEGITPNVYLYFGKKLMVGNRTTKYDSDRFNAYYEKNSIPFVAHGALKIHTEISSKVGLVKIHPGITVEALNKLCECYEGIVVESYGTGNVPMDIIKALHNISEKKIVVNVSQCVKGGVSCTYESGSLLSGNGFIVSGLDMTTEAALTKLSFLIVNYPNEKVREMLKSNLRGEISIK